MSLLNPKDGDNDSDTGWIIYLVRGTQLAATITMMSFLGYWLDKKFNSEPVLTVVFSFLGITAGLYNFIKTVLKSK